jgi:hypothetical protein
MEMPLGDYKASKYYLSPFDHIQVAPQFSWIWKSKCIMRVKCLLGFFSVIGSTPMI